MAEEVQIGKIVFGPDKPCAVIAEACDNHHGSLAEAKALAYAAKESGADIVKFQLHLPEEEMLKKEIEETSGKMFSKWGSLWGFIEQNLLSPDAHHELMRYCEEIGIQYLCTPFSLKAAQLLDAMGACAFKIGSGETEDLPMLEEIAKMQKPIILSTGMTELDELDAAAALIRAHNTPFLLAHCISDYSPKRPEELHLGCISMLTRRYGVVTGLSDHTPPEGIIGAGGRKISEESIIWTALSQGAKFIEKHFTLDRQNSSDADSRFSHEPKTLRNLVAYAKDCESALNNERKVFDNERPVWIWAKRSLVSARDIPAGAIITRDMLASKRPGTGIRSKFFTDVIGKKAVKNIPKNIQISWEMFCN